MTFQTIITNSHFIQGLWHRGPLTSRPPWRLGLYPSSCYFPLMKNIFIFWTFLKLEHSVAFLHSFLCDVLGCWSFVVDAFVPFTSPPLKTLSLFIAASTSTPQLPETFKVSANTWTIKTSATWLNNHKLILKTLAPLKLHEENITSWHWWLYSLYTDFI